ncbi:MAG: response regulator transcription factor [Lewinellaceae bacterium]|nr:response regulator transcription factor [Saprospiraceae bacterium]MCB9317022.1 response regulator transcription factor [Lewinellaceae bacterium]MCB9332165.1 response regulator transcription factor [Lewinellaceae bacterium]
MKSILFVDDEMQFSAMVAEYLQEKGFEVILKHNATDGLTAFRTMRADCCILDVKMPFKDGFSLAADIRDLDEQVPIIFLTGQTNREDRIKGLTIGADDYVTKPFSMEELYLRIKAVLRRVGYQEETREQAFILGQYSFDPISRELVFDGDQPIRLSAMESKLLQVFFKHKNKLVTRDFVLAKVWQDDDQLKSRSLNVYITKLRNYLKQDPSIEILNAHGEGYKLVVK